jgi:hypothetical protein
MYCCFDNKQVNTNIKQSDRKALYMSNVQKKHGAAVNQTYNKIYKVNVEHQRHHILFDLEILLNGHKTGVGPIMSVLHRIFYFTTTNSKIL